MNPFTLLLNAIRAVPAVRYALGVVGIVAVVALAASLYLKWMTAVLGSLVVVMFMILLLLFEQLTKIRSNHVRWAAQTLVWLVVVAVALLISSVFFNAPIPRRDLGLSWAAEAMQQTGHEGPAEVKIQAARLIRARVEGHAMLEVVVANEFAYAVPLLTLYVVGEHDWGMRCEGVGTRHSSWQTVPISWPMTIAHQDPGSPVWTLLGPEQQIAGTAKFRTADCSNYSHRLSISVPVQTDLAAHGLTRIAFDVEEDWRAGSRTRGPDDSTAELEIPNSLFEWRILGVKVETVGGAGSDLVQLER